MNPIYLLVPPGVSTVDEATVRLTAELRVYTDVAVEIRDDVPASDTDNAFLLVLSNSPSEWMLSLPVGDREETLGRALPLQCVRPPGLLQLLEEHHLAGGLDYLRFSMWEAHPSRESGYGIAGLRQVVDRLGGECAPKPFTSAHYCIYRSPTSKSLPEALVEYLNALAEMRGRHRPA